MKRILLAATLIASLSGCAVLSFPQQRVPIDQLEHWQVDCSRRSEHISYLNTLVTNQNDRKWAFAQYPSTGSAMYSRDYDRRVGELLSKYRNECAGPKW